MRISNKISVDSFFRYLVYLGIALIPFEHVLDLTSLAGTMLKPYRVVFLLAAFFKLFESISNGKTIVRKYFILISVFFLYGFILACINSVFLDMVNIVFTYEDVRLVSFSLMIYYVFSTTITTEDEGSKCCYIFMMSLVLSIILSYYFRPMVGARYMGFFGNPNGFGFVCVIGFNFIASKLNTRNNKMLTLFNMSLIIFFCMCIVSTLSRGALGCLLISIIMYVFFYIRQGKFFNVFFLLTLLFMGFVFVLSSGDSFSRISLDSIFTDGGGGREYLWKAAIKLFQDYPWGVGLGQFRSFCITYLPPEAAEVMHSLALGVHNQYISILVEFGLFGFGIYLLCCGFILKQLLQLFYKRGGEQMVYFLLTSFVSMLCMDLTQLSYFSPVYWFMLSTMFLFLSSEKVHNKQGVPELLYVHTMKM